jgi:hypothetical protein
MGRAHHPIGHGPSEVGTLVIAHGQVESTLGMIERLDRDQHGSGTDVERVSRQR